MIGGALGWEKKEDNYLSDKECTSTTKLLGNRGINPSLGFLLVRFD